MVPNLRPVRTRVDPSQGSARVDVTEAMACLRQRSLTISNDNGNDHDNGVTRGYSRRNGLAAMGAQEERQSPEIVLTAPPRETELLLAWNSVAIGDEADVDLFTPGKCNKKTQYCVRVCLLGRGRGHASSDQESARSKL